MLLVDVELFETAVEVVSSIVPRVRRPMLIGVCPAVGQEDLAGIILDVGKSIQYVGELISGNLLWLMIAAIDGPVLFASSVIDWWPVREQYRCAIHKYPSHVSWTL